MRKRHDHPEGRVETIWVWMRFKKPPSPPLEGEGRERLAKRDVSGVG